jgi:multiple sugar transport system substrate-binding protein
MARKQSDSSASRRRFIKVAGAAGIAGLAGCTGGGSGGGDPSGGGSGGGGSGDGASAGNGGSSGPIELQFWTLFAGGDGKTMKELVQQFNDEHDDIQIKRERQPFAEYYDKLFTSMTGGNAPDLGIFHTTEIRRFVDAMTPLDDLISSGTSSAYVDSIWNETEFEGNHVALPLDTHPNGLYYNKDIFEEAGLDPESPPTNYEDLKSAADTIVSETGAQTLAFNPEPYSGFYVRQYIAWLRGRGSPFLNEDRTKAMFDNADGRALGKFYADIGANTWDKPDASENRGTKAFRAGDLAMTVNGTWYFGVLQQQDYNWGMAKPFVAPNMKDNFTWANSHTIGVPRSKNRSDAKTQAAVEAAEWLTQNSLVWGTKAGHMPAAQNVHESSKLRNSTVWEKTLSTFNEMAQDGQLAYMPSTENNENYKRPMNNALAQIYSKQVEPAEGISKAAKEITSNLSG